MYIIAKEDIDLLVYVETSRDTSKIHLRVEAAVRTWRFQVQVLLSIIPLMGIDNNAPRHGCSAARLTRFFSLRRHNGDNGK